MMTDIRLPDVSLKRAYEPPAESDGARILVDRLWPRGLAKAEAGIDRWLKDLAPSNELRRWYGHDPGRWDEFRRRYAEELRNHEALLDELRALAREKKITLLFAARDAGRNNAAVLRNALLGEDCRERSE